MRFKVLVGVGGPIVAFLGGVLLGVTGGHGWGVLATPLVIAACIFTTLAIPIPRR